MSKQKNIKIIFYFLCILYPLISYSSNKIEITYPKTNFTTVNSSISIRWNKAISGVNMYQIQVSDTVSFSSILINQFTGTNSYVFSFPQKNKTYYIRIRGTQLSVWSDVNSIRSLDLNISRNKIWLSSENTTSTGNLVTSWTDVLNSNTATQANVNNQPKLNIFPLLNNLPVVTFDGTASNPDYLSLAISKALNKSFDLFAVRDYANNSNPLQYFLGGPVNGFYSEGDAVGGGYGCLGFDGANFTLISSDPFLLNTLPSIYEQQPTKNYRNRLPEASTSGPAVGLNINTIGTRPDAPNLSFQGNISEMILFDTIMNDVYKEDINNYLHDKYAPPLNLGEDTLLGNSFCDSVVIDAGNRFVTYRWSTGSTSQTIKVVSGTYNLLVRDIFGRESTDDIIVYPYTRLNNKTVYICNGDTFKLDLKTPLGFTALWNTGANTTKLNITSAGQYSVIITDGRGCKAFDTIYVVVDKPQLSPSPNSFDSLRICQDEKLFLITSTSYDSIRWSTGSTAPFISITSEGNYNVYGHTVIGCTYTKSFYIKLAGKAPTSDFSYTPACQKSAMNFIDLSIAPIGVSINSWKWNFSNNTISTIPNPTTTFDTTGTFSAALKITTTQGCSDSIFKTFTVNKNPKAQFTNRKSCEGNPTTFEDKSVPNAASITNWKWDFAGLGIINDIQNPAFAFPSANTYNVNLLVTNSNGCKDTVTNQVKVDQSPIADFSFDAVCGRSPVNFRFLASVPPAPNPPQPTIATWQWDFGDNTFNSSIKDVSHSYDATGTYTVKLTVTSSEQCPNTIEKQVKVYEYPVVDFDISATQCAGKDIQFTDLSQTPDGTPMTSWQWYFSGQSTDTMQNTSYAFATEGNYTIQLTAANAVGCTGTKLRSVAVSGLPVPKFTFSPQNGLPPLIVNYTNQSPVSGSYIWDYGDNSPLVSGYNPPTHTYNVKGTYPIKLIATNFRGCTDTLTKQILVDKAFIDGVMTSITIIPNGDYYQIQVTILNASNIEIRDLGLNIQLGGGAVIRENWTGSLLPGQSTVYSFIGQINIGENGIPVICSTIDNVNNNSPEDVTTNNTTCKEVRVGSFDVLNIYPNPAYEVINFGIMLPKDGRVTIGFIDILGQTMFKKDYDGVRGYNNFTLSTAQLNAAVYVAVVTYDNQIIRNKIMRRDRK